MSTQLTQSTPYLRNQREFPVDPQALSVELNKSYVDIAQNVNNRTIGIFPTTVSAVNGESWYVSGGSQGKLQGLRKVFEFSDANLVFAHNIDYAGLSYVTRMYGAFFDGTLWDTLPFVDVTSATSQVTVQLSSTQVVVTKGAGSPPTIVRGLLVVEWLSIV